MESAVVWAGQKQGLILFLSSFGAKDLLINNEEECDDKGDILT